MVHQSDWQLILALHNYKSVTKASQALYIAQPAVTRRLSQLEDEFHVTIAIRNSKGLLFTPEGEFLADYAEHMVNEYEQLQSHLRAADGKPFGTLHIAASSSLSRFLLPGLLGSFKKKYSEVEFSLESEFSFKVSQMVNTQKAHVGFIRGDYESGCEHFLIGTQKAVIASAKPFDWDDLPQMPRIDFYADALSLSNIDKWWYEYYKEAPKISMTVNNGHTCAEMVKNGLGYAVFLTSEFIQDTDGICIRPLKHPDGSFLIRNDWMIYREEFLEMGLVKAFVDYAKKYTFT